MSRGLGAKDASKRQLDAFEALGARLEHSRARDVLKLEALGAKGSGVHTKHTMLHDAPLLPAANVAAYREGSGNLWPYFGR
ncbi:hypothetical protein RW092_04995 [Paenibacillus sp. 3LSP]|uniref:hypothetical protein n=1 Tax=Paenibacillus barengoltzii TaxID=343517 RepID=UPI00048D6403|nr:hypothetical protein [Paenibacillus sp. 3LSP]